MACLQEQVRAAELQLRAAASLQIEEDRQAATRASEHSEERLRLAMAERTERVQVGIKDVARRLEASGGLRDRRGPLRGPLLKKG
eukprot:3048521-Pyramimonas_sp.AAC.1